RLRMLHVSLLLPSGGSQMPNDAKLGLVVGLGLVIAVAVIYFRNDSSRKREETPAATVVKPASATRQPPPPRGQARAPKARAPAQFDGALPRRHTVAEGDTLASLAEHYYGDREKADEIFRANREQLASPDTLPVGIVLIIPVSQAAKSEDTSK